MHVCYKIKKKTAYGKRNLKLKESATIMSFLRDKVKPDMRYLVSKQAVVFVLSIPPNHLIRVMCLKMGKVLYMHKILI